MHRSFRVLAAMSVVATWSLVPAAATAQPAASGFALDRFNPSERGSEWFALDSLDLRGNGRPAIGIVAEMADSPLVIYNADGSVRDKPVHYSLILHPGASVVLWDRLRLGFDLPIAAYQQGDTGTVGGVSYVGVGQAGIGDLRLSADVRLLGQYGDPFRLAVGTQLFVPVGDRGGYLSDGSTRIIIPRVAAAGDVGIFSYSASLGFNYRSMTDTFAGTGLGSEFVFGASAGVHALDRKLIVGPELYGSTIVTRGAAFATPSTPLEVLLGAHYLVASNVRVGLGAAPGLTKGLGEPSVRYLASVEWAPQPAPARPAEPPPPPPPEPSDRDHDGILDVEDACPDVPGIRTDDPRTNGCPPDRDHDGIPDAEDACPDVPGPRNPDPKINGCPPATIANKQIVIEEQVKFEFGSAKLLPASDPTLGVVLKVLAEHPEVQHLRIEGHTDNVNTAEFNKKLSKDRAASCVAWLIKHGVDPARLSSDGFGFDRPIDTNETPEGRQNNRRVEFHIVDSVTAESN
jgi:OOP family OmpA-OmpF porin